MSVIQEIQQERLRQVEAEGWGAEHDDQHTGGELAQAAACYAVAEEMRVLRHAPIFCDCREHACIHGIGPVVIGCEKKLSWIDAWPWSEEWDKRLDHDRRRQLVIAGALIVAEIERLDRMKETDA